MHARAGGIAPTQFGLSERQARLRRLGTVGVGAHGAQPGEFGLFGGVAGRGQDDGAFVEARVESRAAREHAQALFEGPIAQVQIDQRVAARSLEAFDRPTAEMGQAPQGVFHAHSASSERAQRLAVLDAQGRGEVGLRRSEGQQQGGDHRMALPCASTCACHDAATR